MGRRRINSKPTAIGTLTKAVMSVTNNAETAFKKSVFLPHLVTYTEDEVVQQSRVLCRDFIYIKLRENSLLDENVLRHDQEEGEDDEVKVPTDVAKEIIAMAAEFEQLYPYLFEDLGTYLKMTYQNVNQVKKTYHVAAHEIFKGGITWACVIALFLFTGALTVDCVRQGHGKFGNQIVDCMQKFVREKLAPWIVSQGGWPGLLDHFHQYHKPSWQLWAAGSVGTIVGIILAVLA
ncbi:bcl-2-related ovarian killer protein homolog B-like [Amphiura filiformis]|uniref:bcl-2-related ovarian killer protein homolog B-like n=1 Tax=Amphiura filiformis TaxID=82378 RepID=UPI003B222F1D